MEVAGTVPGLGRCEYKPDSHDLATFDTIVLGRGLSSPYLGFRGRMDNVHMYSFVDPFDVAGCHQQ
jgi:hypothetical protein